MPRVQTNGYRRVGFGGEQSGGKHLVHRLVALAFKLPRLPGQDTVDHINGDPSDNHVANLRWASQREQNTYSYATNMTRGSNAGRQSKPVRCRSLGGNNEDWTTYPSICEAVRVLHLHAYSVHQCIVGKLKHVGGLEFEYADPTEPDVLDGEEWRTIEGTTAAISSLGRVRSARGVVSTPKASRDGYRRTQVGGKNSRIHRLLAVAFNLPRRPDQLEVDHINNDPSDNRLCNLRWASREEQVRHSYVSNMMRSSHTTRQKKPISVRKVGSDDWVTFASMNEAAQSVGMTRSRLTACNGHKRTQIDGYEFAWPTEPDIDGEEWRDVVLESERMM